MTSDGNIYLLQYGSYISKNIMEENIKKLDDYFVYEEDNKYYVFLGAYTKLDNANKVSKILEKNNLYTYIKNDYLGNSDVISEIEKLEIKIMEEDDHNKILKINKEILEILKKI